MRFILLTLAGLVLVCTSSSLGQTVPGTPAQQLDKLLGRKVVPQSADPAKRLTDCESKVSELQSWIDKNYPIGKRLEEENAKLEGELAELGEDYASLSGKAVK